MVTDDDCDDSDNDDVCDVSLMNLTNKVSSFRLGIYNFILSGHCGLNLLFKFLQN
jgi:hypothetical protein